MNNAEYPEYDPVSKKRFRWIGKCCKEYEPVFVSTMGNIPESQRKNLFTTQSVKEIQIEKAEVQDYGDCPFKKGVAIKCSESCAWCDKGCILTRSGDAETALKDSGGNCPISGRKCVKTCAMYHDNRCAIVDGFNGRRTQ